MLSVIFYGRNDSYGYNMHKRVAISINAVAEVLTHPDDEILFVDYNTPDDYPTLLEAIQDTLTQKAKEITKVLRVRPQVHKDFFEGKTRLKAIEPISRNIALRRSNPKNRWILSSNTDMVFVARDQKKSLSDIVSTLKDGFYGIPRFEMPETLWESLDRKNPCMIIDKFKLWGKTLHINEVVYGNDLIIYDAPGDFQLALRKDLFNIQGFDESMVLGWHVDSNLTKRMSLFGRNVQSLLHKLYGYHCDHTKQVTPMHDSKRIENDSDKYIFNVSSPYIPKQEFSWGLPKHEIETICLKENSIAEYTRVMQNILPKSKQEYYETTYNTESYDECLYSPEHIMPYLIEYFVSYPKNIKIGYLGANSATLGYLLEILKKLGFSEKLYVFSDKVIKFPEHISSQVIVKNDIFEVLNKTDLFVVEFGTEAFDNSIQKADRKVVSYINKCYRKIIFSSQSLFKKFIIVNSIHNSAESTVKITINSVHTPFSSRIRTGYRKNSFLITFRLKIYLSSFVQKIRNTFKTRPTIYRFLKIIYKNSGLSYILK